MLPDLLAPPAADERVAVMDLDGVTRLEPAATGPSRDATGAFALGPWGARPQTTAWATLAGSPSR